MRGGPLIIAVFEIAPHAFPLQSPVGLAERRRRGRKGEQQSVIVYYSWRANAGVLLLDSTTGGPGIPWHIPSQA